MGQQAAAGSPPSGKGEDDNARLLLGVGFAFVLFRGDVHLGKQIAVQVGLAHAVVRPFGAPLQKQSNRHLCHAGATASHETAATTQRIAGRQRGSTRHGRAQDRAAAREERVKLYLLAAWFPLELKRDLLRCDAAQPLTSQPELLLALRCCKGVRLFVGDVMKLGGN